MVTPVIMPKQGQSVESCILTTLYKKVGDPVAKGELLFAYETDKASFEEPSQTHGTVLAVFFQEGDEIPVYQNVMLIGQAGDDISAYSATSSPEGRPAEDEAAKDKAEARATLANPLTSQAYAQMAFASVGKALAHEEAPEGEPAGALRISPRALKLAKRYRLNPHDLEGTGPGGRVNELDVLKALERRQPLTGMALAKMKELRKEERAASAPARGSGLGGMVTEADITIKKRGRGRPPKVRPVAPAPAPMPEFEWKPLSNMRKIIGKAMAHSIQSSAQLTHHLSADARRILDLRQKVKKALSVGFGTDITLNDMVCFAVCRALEKFPQVNAHLVEDRVKYFKKIHLGLAVDTERGLMVPAVRNAGEMTLPELSQALKATAQGCKIPGGINPDLLSSEAAGFTVSNLGNYGVEMFTPIINLPQVAILGVNTLVLRPKDIGNGTIAFVPHIGLSLTYDHRALDGGPATLFLKQIAIEIENLSFDIE